MSQYCCVKGCTTDEDDVSHTSLFFVKFPFDQELLDKWIAVLIEHDPSVTDLLHSDARICSCHFHEDDFGHHSEFGYRYLLPTAVPSKFPSVTPVKSPAVEQDDRLDQYDMVALEDNDLITNELDLIENDKEITLKDELFTIEETSGKETEVEEGLGEQVPVQEIGIEYADGVYYFLQSENESDLESVSVEQEEIDESAPPPEALVTEQDLVADDSDMLVYYEEKEKYEFESSVQNGIVLVVPSNEGDETNEMEKVEITSDQAEDQDNTSVVESEYYGLEMLHETISMVDDTKTVSSVYTALEVLEDTSTITEGSPTGPKTIRVNRHFCDTCGKGFPYESALVKHTPVHTGLKEHVCKECGKTFSQKINLTVHMRKHNGTVVAKKHECHICQKKCARMSELKTHLKTHWKQFPHWCALCPERFKEFTCYVDHVKATHRSELTTTEFAGMIAQNENTRVITGSKIDAFKPVMQDGIYTCTFCSKQCKTTTFLKRHIRLMHPKVFVCPYCQKRYLYRSHLEKHVRVHTNEKPFACTKCDQLFSQKINLDVHMKRRHTKSRIRGKRHFLPFAEVGEKSSAPATEKMVLDAPEEDSTLKATGTVSCSDCSRTFETMAGMKRHHTNMHVGKGDTASDLLPMHVKYVVFSCDMCKKVFYNKDTLVSHRQRHHSKTIESDKFKLAKVVHYDSAMDGHLTEDPLAGIGDLEKGMHTDVTDFHSTVEVPLTTIDGSDIIQYSVDLFG